MRGITIANVSTLAAYEGPHAIPGIRFRAAREPLGVSSWGMNVLELDAGCELCPEHDHTSDGQEEVYVVLSGAVVLRASGEERTLVAGDMARVAPDVRRKLVTRGSPATVLALGGNPGKPYSPSMGG